MMPLLQSFVTSRNDTALKLVFLKGDYDACFVTSRNDTALKLFHD